jgi:aminoglycoside phosphotransferase (APT) family kinase protein
MSAVWPDPIRDLAEDVAAACRDAFPAAQIVSVTAAPTGHSGFTYLLGLDGPPGGAVVRVPPPGARPVGPADVVRQGRIMAALHAAGLPAPRVLAMREAAATRAGRPFVLMEMVAGETVDEIARLEPAAKLIGSALSVLDRIRRLPVERTGIGDEPTHPPLRQVDRWEPLMARGPAHLVTRAPELAARLRDRAPAPGASALSHGDYTLGNLLFREGEVVAVLDWEIAELGRPEVDLACLCVTALRRRFSGVNRGGQVEVTVDEILAGATGYVDMEWFLAASCYKYAAILAYNLDLHIRGRRIDPVYEDLRESVSGLIDAGLDALA